MFIGRSRELNKLNALYNSNQFEFAVFLWQKACRQDNADQ